MEVLSRLVFNDQRIATNALVAKELGSSIDAASKLMFEFYQKRQKDIETYFLAIRKEGTDKVILDRVPEPKIKELFSNKEYANSVMSLKVWAFYDKKKGELDVYNIYNAEETDLHSIPNLCEKLRDINIRKEAEVKKVGVASSSQSIQLGTKDNQSKTAPVREKAVAKPANAMEEEVVKPPVLTDIKNQVKPSTTETSTQKKEKESFFGKSQKEKPETAVPGTVIDDILYEKSSLDTKKRKGGAGDIEQASGKAQELKKVKLTSQKEEHKKNQGDSAIEIEEDENHYGGTVKEAEKPIEINLKKDNSKSQKNNQKENNTKSSSMSMNKQKSMPDDIEDETTKKTIILSNTSKGSVADSQDDGEEYVEVKRIRKVPREKSYMDEKGYFSVESEMVEEEYIEKVKKKTLAKPSNVQSQMSAQLSQKKPIEKNQATLGSFFKKR